jgi:hypothetical protein
MSKFARLATVTLHPRSGLPPENRRKEESKTLRFGIQSDGLRFFDSSIPQAKPNPVPVQCGVSGAV